jgi:succinoglycan biosynthesis protein ExoA
VSERPRIDVVVPAFNEEAHIDACVGNLLTQRYPSRLVSVWVVDAGSTDATGARVSEMARGDPRLRLVEGGRRLNAAEAMNAGISGGTAPLVARVDAHTVLDPDYLRRAADAFAGAGPDLACVGGQPEQVGETRFGRAVALARASPFGVGGSVYADRRAWAFVDTVQAGVYRRAALDAVGGFATNMLVGEDEELNWRLRRSGYRILLDTGLRFRYTTRSSWTALYRQYRNYGRARARVLAAHPDFLRARHLVPSALVCALAGLAVAALGSRKARRDLVAAGSVYAAAATAAGLVAARSVDPRLGPAVTAAFPALHVGYGVGFLGGLAELAGARLGGRGPARAVSRR